MKTLRLGSAKGLITCPRLLVVVIFLMSFLFVSVFVNKGAAAMWTLNNQSRETVQFSGTRMGLCSKFQEEVGPKSKKEGDDWWCSWKEVGVTIKSGPFAGKSCQLSWNPTSASAWVGLYLSEYGYFVYTIHEGAIQQSIRCVIPGMEEYYLRH